MTQPTKSEMLFEGLCDRLGIPYQGIERGPGKTPDYDITLGSQIVVTEVKQLEESDNDRRLLAEGAGWETPGRRIRLKIDASKKQLRSRAGGTLPTLLVVYDNGTFHGTEIDDIKTAMYGDEVVTVKVERATREHVAASAIRPGGGRKCTASDNNYLSAIALMWDWEDGARLSVFHNHFADNPINPSWFRSPTFRHYACDPATSPYAWSEV